MRRRLSSVLTLARSISFTTQSLNISAYLGRSMPTSCLRSQSIARILRFLPLLQGQVKRSKMQSLWEWAVPTRNHRTTFQRSSGMIQSYIRLFRPLSRREEVLALARVTTKICTMSKTIRCMTQPKAPPLRKHTLMTK